MALSMYVYYRVPAPQETAFSQAAITMQKQLATAGTISMALKRRPETSDGMHTWMEVYESVPDNFGRVLESAVQEAGLEKWIAGVRHAEYFQDVHPCA